MSQSTMTENDAAWTQTLLTVTPQEDGSLREIEENVVISGIADTPLHLDTENIVLRRSLMNNTIDFINPMELEPLKRVAAECQTYLQGVPKVELPLIYKEEATQTLYMRTDEQRTAVADPFRDIIKVMNEKPLPELKMTRIVQTIITFEGLFCDNLSEKLRSDISETELNGFREYSHGNDEENAVAEALDIMNFVIERTLWMSEPETAAKREKINAETQTSVKYNKDTKKITIDNEVQTNLSCEPRESNTMLLSEYNEAKIFCLSILQDCLEKGVYPRIIIDEILDRIITKCCNQIYFPLQEENAMSIGEVSKGERKIYRHEKTNCQAHKCSAKCAGKVCPKLNRKNRRTEDILFAESPAYVIRTNSQAENDPNLKPSCPMKDYDTMKTSFDDSSSSESIEQISPESSRHLNTKDEEALKLLKSAFCNRKTCTKR